MRNRRIESNLVLVLFALSAGLMAPALPAVTLPAGFTETLVASGISSATAMEFAPDGRLFVCQQNGQLRVIKNGVLLGTPFLTLTVDSSGERGLLGIAFDPNFNANQYVYLYYTVPGAPAHNRLSRFTGNGDVVLPNTEMVLLELNNLSSAQNHNGGGTHFGADGKLYLSVGENANSAYSQTLTNLLGKILRLNPDGSAPTNNPFYNTASGVNRAIWALGMRNPFTFAVQPGTGRIFINDVGQNSVEEINDGVAGANYGWPGCEGACSPANPNFRDPIYQYSHAEGCAITGGTFYNPTVSQFPSEYVGDYFFAEYCSGWIRKLDPANGNSVTTFATGLTSPVDLKVSADGLLYYLDRGRSSVYKIQFATAPSITMHPTDQVVAVGESATFTVGASGTPPLNYQWQRNGSDISGGNSTSYTIASVSQSDDGAMFRCRVSNAYGTVTSNPAELIIDSNTPPTATVSLPSAGALYSGGETIQFAGTASDAEDVSLPASAFSWTVVFHHDTHTHPFLGPITNVTSGSFTIPDSGETATTVFYRVHLTVTDSGGMQGTAFVDIFPRTATITLASDPTGMTLTLDGQPVTAPFSAGSVVGMKRMIGAVSPQKLGKTQYEFVDWSDGGTATHQITTPESDNTYTATFRKRGRKP